MIDALKARYPGFQVVGTTAHHEKTLSEVDFTKPTMLLIGNETEGLRRIYKERSDVLATIPMNPRGSASSFNVACAATVMFYEARAPTRGGNVPRRSRGGRVLRDSQILI